MPYDAPEPWRADLASSPERPRLRPPVGIPGPRTRPLPSLLLSMALHGLVVLLILAPFVAPAVLREVVGAGDAGPAGGGGGGQRGAGGDDGGWNVRERLHFIQIVPATPPTPAPPVAPPPVVRPPAPPIVKPPPAPIPPPRVAVPTPVAAAPAAVAGVAAPVPGTGGGTGADGTNGTGPGSGGGVGAGVGTGQGSGVGPGTGGAGGASYEPQMIEMFIPPLPQPARVRGHEVVAVFDVDSTGRVLSVEFTPTPDRGYNKKLREVLTGFRFRPGTTPSGHPIRAKASVTYVL